MKIQKTESSKFLLIDPQIEGKFIYFDKSVIDILKEKGFLKKEITELTSNEEDINLLEIVEITNKDT
ncbi:hypothetical protein [Crocosphaera chwakensis]|nr:hypothetical protein [Crocosphaera chwakensis]